MKYIDTTIIAEPIIEGEEPVIINASGKRLVIRADITVGSFCAILADEVVLCRGNIRVENPERTGLLHIEADSLYLAGGSIGADTSELIIDHQKIYGLSDEQALAFYKKHQMYDTMEALELVKPNVNRDLRKAAQDGNLIEVIRLFEEENANPNGQARNGRTALHFAVSNNRQDVVKYLASKTDITIKDIEDKTPLAIAESKGYTGLLPFLGNSKQSTYPLETETIGLDELVFTGPIAGKNINIPNASKITVLSMTSISTPDRIVLGSNDKGVEIKSGSIMECGGNIVTFTQDCLLKSFNQINDGYLRVVNSLGDATFEGYFHGKFLYPDDIATHLIAGEYFTTEC